MPIEQSARVGSLGMGVGLAGFSSQRMIRELSSTVMTPKFEASASGYSMAPTTTSACVCWRKLCISL